jgi:hypothetical protein
VIWLHGIAGCVSSRLADNAFDGLADLQQSDPHGIEDQPVGESASLQVRADRVERGLDVGQSLPVPGSSQDNQVSASALADFWLEIGGRYQVDAGTDDGFQFSLQACQAE